MTDEALWAAFRLWLAVAAVLVLVVAGLLIWIAVLAGRIAATAAAARATAERIRQGTLPIWNLQDTNDVAGRLLTSAREIRAKAELVADTVEGHAVPARRP